jgi:hypothetical protein
VLRSGEQRRRSNPRRQSDARWPLRCRRRPRRLARRAQLVPGCPMWCSAALRACASRSARRPASAVGVRSDLRGNRPRCHNRASLDGGAVCSAWAFNRARSRSPVGSRHAAANAARLARHGAPGSQIARVAHSWSRYPTIPCRRAGAVGSRELSPVRLSPGRTTAVGRPRAHFRFRATWSAARPVGCRCGSSRPRRVTSSRPATSAATARSPPDARRR